MSASLDALTDELLRKAAVGTVQEVSGLLNKGVDVDIDVEILDENVKKKFNQ